MDHSYKIYTIHFFVRIQLLLIGLFFLFFGSIDIYAFCGDGVRDPLVEECDDNNNDPGDGCSSDCSTEPMCLDVSYSTNTFASVLEEIPTLSLGTLTLGNLDGKFGDDSVRGLAGLGSPRSVYTAVGIRYVANNGDILEIQNLQDDPLITLMNDTSWFGKNIGETLDSTDPADGLPDTALAVYYDAKSSGNHGSASSFMVYEQLSCRDAIVPLCGTTPGICVSGDMSWVIQTDSCGQTQTWECAGDDAFWIPNNTISCTYTNEACPVCSTTFGQCTVGNPTNLNNTACNTNDTRVCEVSRYDGSDYTTNCSKSDPCPTCGYTVGQCGVGSAVNEQDNDCDNRDYWDCVIADHSVSCSDYIQCCTSENGTCGSSNECCGSLTCSSSHCCPPDEYRDGSDCVCDPDFGNSCTRTNACGDSNTGTVECDGSCSVSAPGGCKTCNGGEHNGDVCVDDTDCEGVSKTCNGGNDDGNSCFTNSNCRDDGACNGGVNDGNSCLYDSDCEQKVCRLGDPVYEGTPCTRASNCSVYSLDGQCGIIGKRLSFDCQEDSDCSGLKGCFGGLAPYEICNNDSDCPAGDGPCTDIIDCDAPSYYQCQYEPLYQGTCDGVDSTPTCDSAPDNGTCVNS